MTRKLVLAIAGLAALSVWGLTPGLADGGVGGMFVDVPTSHPAYTALRDLVSRGVITIGAGGEFAGAQPLTRYDGALWIYRAIKNVEGSMTSNTLSTTVASLDTKVKALDASLTREIAAVRAELAAMQQSSVGAETAQKAQTAFVLGVTAVVLALAAVAIGLWF